MLRSLAVYVSLLLFAAVTMVPFAYLICSAIKPQSVFFTSPFLPEASLLEIDPSTGELTVVDVTRLPRDAGGEPRQHVYELQVQTAVVDGEPRTQGVRVGFATPPDAAVDFVIPPDATPNTSLGRVEPTSTAGPGGWVRYAILEGNDAGWLGRAWGLLTLDNFDRLFRGTALPGDEEGERADTGVLRAIVNSFFFASVSAVLATLGAAMGGYALAKFTFRGRVAIDNIVLASLVIPGALLIAPGYQLLYWLGLLDSYAGLILPGIAPAFGVFLFRQAMISSLPNEMIEAARIDGCGELRLFFTMALPMVRPMAGAFLLITYLGAWNNFIGPQIVLSTPEKFPLAVWISQLRGVYGVDYGLIMAGTLVAIAPVLVLFLMLQKEFIAGLTAGAVKG